ncbi:MAG: SDR family NAD(P)-dependent oxidoreductase [Alphaproteobacteria bacterium]|nr:SDR family NAD(P)-dependent oxidoreductase [Alphaproteobacteria bacterium]
MQNLKDKIVVITGGAPGIGFALAKAFGAEGAKIIIGEPRQNRLDEAVSALQAAGVDAQAAMCDVRKLESVEALADFAWAAHGRVDIVLNNAGVSLPPAPVTDVDIAKARDLMDVNFWGVWHGCAVFGKRLAAQGTPSAIYNTGSENAFFPAVPHIAVYVASKHAVLGLTDAFREDMPDFVTVGVIFPGFVRSEMMEPRFAALGMDTDRFAQIVLQQIKAGEIYIVSHAYNVERIAPRHHAVMRAFETYAPRYAGDDEFDVRAIIDRLRNRR